MKQLFLILLAVVCILPVSGQTKNVNIDNVRLYVTTRNTPTKPLNPLFFHYNVELKATPSTRNRVDIEEVEEAIAIRGQKRTDKPLSDDVMVFVNLGNLVISDSGIDERKVEEKDKEGKVTNVYYLYKARVIYKFESSYKVMKGEEILIQGEPYSPGSSNYHYSEEFGSRKDAADYWNNNRDVLISDFTRQVSMNTVKQLTERASSLFGFPVMRRYDIIKTIDEKKHNEQEAFRAASNALKEELESMTGEKGMNRERVDGLIEYFKSIPVKYTDPKLKADIRLRYAAYYNLCKIYLYLDEPDNVAPYADLILSNGHDKKDCERMKKVADELKPVLTRTEIKTRHFDPNQYFNDGGVIEDNPDISDAEPEE